MIQALICRGFFMIAVLRYALRRQKNLFLPVDTRVSCGSHHHLGCFRNQPNPNSCKTLFNNTPGSKSRAVPELTAGYTNMFWKSIPQRGRKQQSHGNTDFLAILENHLGIPFSCPLNLGHPHLFAGFWVSPGSESVVAQT